MDSQAARLISVYREARHLGEELLRLTDTLPGGVEWDLVERALAARDALAAEAATLLSENAPPPEALAELQLLIELQKDLERRWGELRAGMQSRSAELFGNRHAVQAAKQALQPAARGGRLNAMR